MAIFSDSAHHCFAFEQDFIGDWRCIPLCVRRKLDLAGVKLKLNHWLALTQSQRQKLVDWSDDAQSLVRLREHLRICTQEMADGVVKDLPPAIGMPWQPLESVPEQVSAAAAARGVKLSSDEWRSISELDRFALCKLVRPGHDHHNLESAFSEVLG